MTRRTILSTLKRLLPALPFALAAEQENTGAVNFPVCPLGHRNSSARVSALQFQDGATAYDVNFCRQCGAMFITSTAAAPQAVGTLVSGVCKANGTGFHLTSNEPMANCVLPK